MGAMKFDAKEIATATMVLFAVIDIIGSVPIIISLRQKVGTFSRKRQVSFPPSS